MVMLTGFLAMSVMIGIDQGVASMKLPKDATAKDLGDGYVRVTTPDYTIDLPKGWEVGTETPWGQRKMAPSQGRGELGVMTAPPSRQGWDQIYQTSLYFILREERGLEATPYEMTKTKKGYEAAQFGVKDRSGFMKKRYVLIKHEEKGLMALSVSMPNKDSEKAWRKHFQRMVDSATFAGD